MGGLLRRRGHEDHRLYPDGGVSAVQKAQMVTQGGDNTVSPRCAATSTTRRLPSSRSLPRSAARTCSRARACACRARTPSTSAALPLQVVYYFRAYADLVRRGTVAVGERVTTSFPPATSATFSPATSPASWGFPSARSCARPTPTTCFTDFIRTGRYDKKRPFYLTSSPSMDILVSSNLERLLFPALRRRAVGGGSCVSSPRTAPTRCRRS